MSEKTKRSTTRNRLQDLKLEERFYRLKETGFEALCFGELRKQRRVEPFTFRQLLFIAERIEQQLDLLKRVKESRDEHARSALTWKQQYLDILDAFHHLSRPLNARAKSRARGARNV